METLRMAAFSQNGEGGNPAGVVICEQLPDSDFMLSTAADIGYSETAFLAPQGAGWRIRYFAPEKEVPFCGHATIASGAVLGDKFGAGSYVLYLNEGEISVDVVKDDTGVMTSTLHSPGTWSEKVPDAVVATLVENFNFGMGDLDPAFPVRLAFAGAKHLIVGLKDRSVLGQMKYQFEPVRELMESLDLTTINLVWCESEDRFHCRNPFAVGGVYEDPATGAAAAAFAGYLRDIGCPGAYQFEVLQGEDMGVPSRLLVECGPEPGESIRVSGQTRRIDEAAG